MALLSSLFHPLQQRGANWMSSYQKQQFLGNYNADRHLKAPFVLGYKRSGREEENRESTLFHRTQTQRPWQLHKQNSPVIPTFSYLFSSQEEEFELSKSILFTKKPLHNFSTQINREEKKKMAPGFPGSHNTKYI